MIKKNYLFLKFIYNFEFKSECIKFITANNVKKSKF